MKCLLQIVARLTAVDFPKEAAMDFEGTNYKEAYHQLLKTAGQTIQRHTAPESYSPRLAATIGFGNSTLVASLSYFRIRTGG